jgi:hypothetical protein
MAKALYTLNDPDSGKSLAIEVDDFGGELSIRPVGYGTPVKLMYYAGYLSVLLFREDDEDSPEQIELEPRGK